MFHYSNHIALAFTLRKGLTSGKTFRNNLFATWLSKVTTKNADLSKEPIRFYFRIIFVYGTALNSRFRLTTRFHKMSPKSQGCNVKPLVVQYSWMKKLNSDFFCTISLRR